MTKSRIATGLILLLTIVLLSSCSGTTSKTIIQMEMSKGYDTSEPFINENLIYLSDNIDTLNLDVSFQLEGKSCTLEIADNLTKQVVWDNTWNENVEKTDFIISLDSLEKDKEYVIRLTGTGITYVKTVITTDDKLVKAREKPAKPLKA